MEDCIFCKIIKGEITSNIVYQDEDFVIFPDINPQAPIHYLAVPKKHFPLLKEMDEADKAALGRILYKISTLESDLGLENGYRVLINQKGEQGTTLDK